MTFAEAFDRIQQERPGLTFKIGVEAWHHDHDPRASRNSVEWGIWNAETDTRTVGPTLDDVVARFLHPLGSISEVSLATAT